MNRALFFLLFLFFDLSLAYPHISKWICNFSCQFVKCVHVTRGKKSFFHSFDKIKWSFCYCLNIDIAKIIGSNKNDNFSLYMQFQWQKNISAIKVFENQNLTSFDVAEKLNLFLIYLPQKKRRKTNFFFASRG